MRVILAALNAKYIHTNLAVRLVAGCAKTQGTEVAVWERTVNHHRELLLRELVELRPDLVIFSCYIWNVELVKPLAADLQALRPDIRIAAAGPEAAHCAALFLGQNPAFHWVLRGEGEAVVPALLDRLAGGGAVESCPGLAWREGEAVRENPPSAPLPMDQVPFGYDEDLRHLEGRILYYESMRGCPFQCAYCLSSVEQGVRFRSLGQVFAHLGRFLEAGVGQVKLVDRTFNCHRERALQIWRFLRDHDNGVTNFHFELAGDLLDRETVEFLQTVRPGQFQFEIGVQSANPETLRAIRRETRLEDLFRWVEQIRRRGNIHLHLDLIAGLPLEDNGSFVRSFNRVAEAKPHQLQLGFLKVLHGSAIQRRQGEFGIRHTIQAPYEVLQTKWISYPQLCHLKGVGKMVDLYHNSGRFTHILGYLLEQFPTPFQCYESLWELYRELGYELSPLSKLGQYELPGELLRRRTGGDPGLRAQWLCKLDILLHEKPRKLPAWVRVDGASRYREEILAFYAGEDNLRRFLPGNMGQEPKFIARVAHIEVFPFHPPTGQAGETALLFDYSQRDILGHAVTHIIPLPKKG